MPDWVAIALGFAVVALGSYAQRQVRQPTPRGANERPRQRRGLQVGFVIAVSIAALVPIASLGNTVVRLFMIVFIVVVALVAIVGATR